MVQQQEWFLAGQLKSGSYEELGENFMGQFNGENQWPKLFGTVPLRLEKVHFPPKHGLFLLKVVGV